MKERTLAIIKPDSFKKGRVGEILSFLEKKGFNILALKSRLLSRKTAAEFYKVHADKPFFDSLLNFMTEEKCVVVALERENAVEYLREVMGATDPAKAEKGTIRALYGENIERNAIHGSDSIENAKRELNFFFSEEELI